MNHGDAPGDRCVVAYERGGVVHWTHDDPLDRRPGGWIEHAERRYR